MRVPPGQGTHGAANRPALEHAPLGSPLTNSPAGRGGRPFTINCVVWIDTAESYVQSLVNSRCRYFLTACVAIFNQSHVNTQYQNSPRPGSFTPRSHHQRTENGWILFWGLPGDTNKNQRQDFSTNMAGRCDVVLGRRKGQCLRQSGATPPRVERKNYRKAAWSEIETVPQLALRKVSPRP